MRLIDADALIEAINKSTCHFAEELWKRVVCDVISNQPTAYSVEKVVAELEELPNREADYYYAHSNDVIDREDAIDIVKRGGVE